MIYFLLGMVAGAFLSVVIWLLILLFNSVDERPFL